MTLRNKWNLSHESFDDTRNYLQKQWKLERQYTQNGTTL